MADTTNISATQTRVLRMVITAPNRHRQIAGYGNGPLLSAARALVRKGLLKNSMQTGHYYIGRDDVERVNAMLAARSPDSAKGRVGK